MARRPGGGGRRQADRHRHRALAARAADGRAWLALRRRARAGARKVDHWKHIDGNRRTPFQPRKIKQHAFKAPIGPASIQTRPKNCHTHRHHLRKSLHTSADLKPTGLAVRKKITQKHTLRIFKSGQRINQDNKITLSIWLAHGRGERTESAGLAGT